MSDRLKIGNYDEYGYPFIILAAERERTVLSGNDVILSNISAAKSIADTMKTSLGPKGLDKMVIDEDADIIITNDGATILDNMDVDHEVAKLMVQLAKSQDQEVGDGTTSVVVLAGALLEQAESLIKKGLHAIRIADGFELAAEFCVKHLDHIAEQLPVYIDNLQPLIQVAATALGSKIYLHATSIPSVRVKKQQTQLAELAVKAVMNVADVENRTADLNRLRLITKDGKSLQDTTLINGVTLDRSFRHVQTSRTWENAKVALLMLELRIPKSEHKLQLEVGSAEDYRQVKQYEDKVIQNLVDKIKEVGADVVVCLRAVDDDICHSLYQNGIGVIQRAIEPEMDALARATGAKLIPDPNMLSSTDLGRAGSIKHFNMGGTIIEDMIVFEKCSNENVSTVLLRGSNPAALDEAKRSMTDAIKAVVNVIKDNRIVYGGGAAEISCALAVMNEADQMSSMEQYCFKAFAESLESIPASLAENSGYDPIQTLSEIKALHVLENCAIYGVDSACIGTLDMKQQRVVDTLLCKKNQIKLASEMVKMVLKIDKVQVYDKNYGRYKTL